MGEMGEWNWIRVVVWWFSGPRVSVWFGSGLDGDSLVDEVCVEKDPWMSLSVEYSISIVVIS